MSYETRHSAGYGRGRGSAHPATHVSRVQRGSTPHITGLCLISTAGRGKVEQHSSVAYGISEAAHQEIAAGPHVRQVQHEFAAAVYYKIERG